MSDKIQRKPVIYLVVILPVLVIGSFCLVAILIETYSRVTGVSRSAIPNVNGLLITLPALLLWIPITLMLSNVVVHCIPSLRRIAEEYAARTGRPGFARSQKLLLKVAGVCALVCLPLLVLGFVL